MDVANIRYRDSDGKPCDLATLCRREPGWAASRIGVMKQKLAAVGGLVSAVGCECGCEMDPPAHEPGEHDADCERCLSCRIAEVLERCPR
jgi:hypothetical protein